MLNIDKIYGLSESNIDILPKEDFIINLEKSYFDEVLTANKKFIEIQKKEFKSFIADKQDKKNISKEIIKVLLGKDIKVKHLDQWFKKTNLNVAKFLLDYNKNIEFRYHVVSDYLRKDKYSDYARISINIPEDICIFNIEDKDIESNIRNDKLYKQLETIMDLTDIITWKNHPIPREGMFTSKLIPEYLFGSSRDIDKAMNKTHCIKINRGNYRAIDLINIIDKYMKDKKRLLKLLVSIVKDVKEQISLYKSDSEHYIKSFSDQYALSKVFLDDMDSIMDNMHYIYRRFVKQLHDADQIYSIAINEMYDRLMKYRERENDILGKDYKTNKSNLSIKSIGDE